MKEIEINEYIVVNPQVCHGKPVFKGTRIMVWQVLEMLEAGEGIEDILEAFPPLTENHVKAALRYAAALTKGGSYAIISTETSA